MVHRPILSVGYPDTIKIYRGAIDASLGAFPTSVTNSLYIVSNDGTIGDLTLVRGNGIFYDGTQWTKIEVI